MLGKPEAAIAVYIKVLEIDADDLRAIDALIRRYLALSRWHDLLGVYAKKADLVADADEKKRIYYQVGAVYERELGDVPRAIDTYTKILELDPDDLQALSRLDVLYEQAQNWTELLSVLTRESEMTGDANEAISFQYRIAELYEKHLDDVGPRDRALSRDPRAQPDHEPTVRALEGLKSGDRDPLGAAAVLEPIYEVDERLAEPHQRARGAGPARDRLRSRRSSSSTGSRVCTRTRSTTTPRRSTRTRGRSRSTTGTRRRSGTSSVSRWS